MSELTPEETAALVHWSTHGRPGTPPSERYEPTAEELETFEQIAAPGVGPWLDVFDDAQTRSLLNGFPRGEMEDKWIVYSDPISESGTTSIHFLRSWTGNETIRVDLQLTETGSRVTRGLWETDPERIKNPSEEFARQTFVEICRWVLGFEV